MFGVVISEEEYKEYVELKKKNTAMKKECERIGYKKYCPICGYLVDHSVPRQNYCDRCGQRLVR